MLVGDLLRGGFASRDPRIIDEDIDLAMFCRELIRDRGDARRIRHVHDGDLRVKALRPQAGAAGLGRLRIEIGDDDFRSRFSERFRAGKADPLSGARDDGDPAAQSEFLQIHLLLVPVCGRACRLWLTS